MSNGNIFIWNVRGLNMRARRAVVCEFLLQERVSALCLVETKIDVLPRATANDIMGNMFDYVLLPSLGASGGIVVAWRRDCWSVAGHVIRSFSVTVELAPLDAPDRQWSLCAVYGPVLAELKRSFLDELRTVRSAAAGPLLICGDFNLIYQAADKNNDRLDFRAMRRFRRLLDDCLLEELYLHGRLYTWSNERRRPTMERIDRAFASVDWVDAFSHHHLRCLSTDCSDHAPLLLKLCTVPWAKPRFRFECFWVKLPGFEDIVKRAWEVHVPDMDCCRLLDQKLRNTAKALKTWSMQHIGSVRLELRHAREVVAQFDVAQEHRVLSDGEIRLRLQFKQRCLGLASMARTIARQRSRVRYLEDGDANTKFFHLQASHRNRKNLIPTLLHDGVSISADDEKAVAIYEYYNQILGKPFRRRHAIDLGRLLPELDLTGIDSCFSEQEVWEAIKDMPSDRAPGPDGYNGLFYKVAWPVIKVDVLNAINALWSLDSRSFHLLNDAFMILLRKHQAPTSLKDYRPIALMHSFSKLFAKCLARRLAPWLQRIVANNQSAFIKGRLIHDNFRAVQLACRWLHARRFPAVLLKIDIAKAFDSVSWPFLIEIMQTIGFPRRWTEWISILLSTASTRVLINGRPCRRIAHARGLRQGDPISPMLFVMVMEVLNALLREADRRRVLSPLPGNCIMHRASLYADDVVVLLAPNIADFTCLSRILDLFAGASGLVTNVDKCLATPIRCDDEAITAVQGVFPCSLAPFPCKYLGVPLSLRRLRHADEQPLVDVVAARIPTWKAGLLNNAGRALLTKVTLSAIPVHVSIACCLSEWGIKQIDKRRRAFLWTGKENCSGGQCKVAWPVVCRPTELGGLGVLDLRFFGYALRLRWEWLARTQPGCCWAKLPSKTEKVVTAMRDASMTIKVGNGENTLFWLDNWAPVGPLCSFAPALFAATTRPARRRMLHEALQDHRWAHDLSGATTVAMMRDFFRIWMLLRDVHLEPMQPDALRWKWSSDGSYSASSTYRAFFNGTSELRGARQLWKVRAPPRVKIFFWYVLHRRLWISERRARHGLQQSDTCSLCDQASETCAHLFAGCVVARQVWHTVLSRLQLTSLVPCHDDDIVEWWLRERQRLDAAGRKVFDALVLLVSWRLWKARNARVFRSAPVDVRTVLEGVAKEADEWILGGCAPIAAIQQLLSHFGGVL
jgi:exonuclease III